MKIFAFLLVSVALCSQQMVNGSSAKNVLKAVQRSRNNKEALAQALILQALKDSSNAVKESRITYEDRGRARISQAASFLTIQDCGTAGNIVNTVLQASLGWIPNIANAVNVLVNCGISSGCTQVRVDVPAGNTVADIDVCTVSGK